MKDAPLNLDDDRPQRRPAPPARRRPPPGPSGLFALGKWVIAAGGLICCGTALNAPAVQGAVWAGLACFCGIAARLCQAEEHHFKRYEGGGR